MRRVFLIVMDGLGIGELPDAKEYGDEGSNTLKNMAEAAGGLNLPNLEKLGLGNLGDFRGIAGTDEAAGCFGIMAEASKGKDSTTGHWEMMGVIVNEPFPTYPDGFPAGIIRRFEEETGRKVIGNIPASGTEIIKELGSEHIKTGKPIVYTSADSVFQIAAHEDVIPPDELYRMCELARDILQSPHNVSRVIARPFTGKEGSFKRTYRRRDFSLLPHKKTVLDHLSDRSIETVSIGKVRDLFAGKGFTESVKASGNEDLIDKAIDSFSKLDNGLVFVTLVDFDTLYGHRNDPEGYSKALCFFDEKLSDIFELITENDILILTADHGCDPTTESTDHSREYVPLIVYGPAIKRGTDLGLREQFSDIGATVLGYFGINHKELLLPGKSFLDEIR
jgi:phosphopentomutase